MTTWLTREQLVHQVVTLAAQGMSRRAISRALCVSRNTVKSILFSHGHRRARPHSALPAKAERAPRSSKLDPFKPRIAELLGKYPDVTVQRVFEILRDEGFDGGYGTVKNHVRRARPAPKPTPSPCATPAASTSSTIDEEAHSFIEGELVKILLVVLLLQGFRKAMHAHLAELVEGLFDQHGASFQL